MSICSIGMIRRVKRDFFWCVYWFKLTYRLYLCFLEILGPCVVYQVDYCFLSNSKKANDNIPYTRHTLLPIQDVHKNTIILSLQVRFFSKRSTNPPKKCPPKLRLSGLSDVGRYEGRNFRWNPGGGVGVMKVKGALNDLRKPGWCMAIWRCCRWHGKGGGNFQSPVEMLVVRVPSLLRKAGCLYGIPFPETNIAPENGLEY